MITPRPDTRPPRRPLDISDVLRLQSFHDSHGRSAAFSADGRKLAFCSQRPLSTATAHRDWPMTGITRGELHIVDITSGHISKKASFVRYWGEGHMLSGKANIEDLWLRIFDWLEEHSR